MREKFLRKFLMLSASYLFAGQAMAEQDESTSAPSLAELAAAADLVAVVRVLDTDYEYTREFPSGGSAFLEPLITYKASRPPEEILQVYEEGLHKGECYFKNPTVMEEGSRHLVFLKFSKDVKDQYNGLPPGCKLDVLVTDDNRYALRFPLSGLRVSDDVTGLARAMNFQDENAFVADEDITPPVRARLLEEGQLVKEGDRYRYTRGIPLEDIRKLLGPEGVTLDRSLK